MRSKNLQENDCNKVGYKKVDEALGWLGKLRLFCKAVTVQILIRLPLERESQ